MDDIPNWLNNEFLEKALNMQKESNLKIMSSEITIATKPGDNYSSHIYRATVEISINGLQEKKSFIIKTEVTNPVWRKMISDVNAFPREIDAFTIGIPQLQNLIERKAPQFYRPFAAECYYTSIDPPASVLVLEDLKATGFRLANPSEPLDTKHCFLVVNTLAVYHAASVVVNANTSRKLEQTFKENFVYNERSRDILNVLFKPLFTDLVNEAEKWPEFQGEIIIKLRELDDKLVEYMMECMKTNEEDFKVLAHEDPWLNNLMFRYSEDTDEVVDVRFVDFQTYQWNSPVIDLLYFINANATMENIKNPKRILDEYYKRLKKTLAALEHDHLCPSKEYICDEFEKKSKLGVIFGLALRCEFRRDRSVEPDITKLLNNESHIKFSESYWKDAKEMISIFHERGWL